MFYFYNFHFCCCSITQSCPTLCNPMDCSMPAFPVLHHLPELRLMSIESVMPSNHLVLCRPLLLLPSVFPSIRVFSNESALCIRWPGAGFSSPLSDIIHLAFHPLVTIKNWWPGDWWHFLFLLTLVHLYLNHPYHSGMTGQSCFWTKWANWTNPC